METQGICGRGGCCAQLRLTPFTGALHGCGGCSRREDGAGPGGQSG